MSAKDWVAFAKTNGIPLVTKSVTQYWRYGLLAFGFVVMLYVPPRLYERAIRAEVALREAKSDVARAQRANVILSKSNDSLSKKVAAKIQVFHATETRYRTLRDTLYSSDTVEVPQIVELADSALAEADSVIATQQKQIALLTEIVATKDAQISALNRQIKAVLSASPSRFQRIVSGAEKVAAGAAIGWVASR